MSVFDIIVFTILIALTLRGVWKGMISQIVSIGSYFVCWMIASRFAFLIAPSIPAEEPWNQIGAMAVLFVVSLIAVRFFRAVLEEYVKKMHLEGLNKFLGGGCGFLKALLVCMVLTFFAVMVSETSRSIVVQSKSGGFFITLITKSSAFVPQDSYQLLREQLDKFNNTVLTQPDRTLPLTVQTQSTSLISAIRNWWSGTKQSVAENVKEAVNQELKNNLATVFGTPPAAQNAEIGFQSSTAPVPNITAEQLLNNTAAPAVYDHATRFRTK